MKGFLYGRYDVLRGARGYEIFAADRKLSRTLIRQLTPCFSTQDPDFSMLQTLGDFYVYFAAGNGDWVFGRGNVEERGDYFYYMLHGLVLNEHDRKTHAYNPFRLAHLLNPLVGDERQLPALSAEGLKALNQKSSERLGQLVGEIANDREPLRSGAIGLILDQLLRLKDQKNGARLVYDYHPNIDATVWMMVYELLPLGWRKQLSLNTLDVFLKLPTHIQGSFHFRESSAEPVRHLRLFPPEPTPLGHFLRDLGAESELVQKQRMQMVCAMRDDAFEERLPAAVYADHLGAMTRALVRPSIRTMQRWQAIAAGRRLFDWKAHFLVQIWERHASETEFFPDLAATMVTSMQNDYERLHPNLSAADDKRLRATLNRLMLQVEGLRNRELILMVLGSPSLAADYFPKVDDRVLVAAMWDESLDDATFASLLQNRLVWRPAWSEALNGLWAHPKMPQLKSGLLAKIFDMLLEWDTRFAIYRVIHGRFLNDPGAFAECLDQLNHRRLIISRFIGMLARMLVWAPARDMLPIRSLLRICLKKEPERFHAIASSWIQQRASEYMLPKLAGDEVLAPELLSEWVKAGTDELTRLRLLHFVKLMYPNVHPYDWSHPEVISVLKGNAMFECLLEV